MTYYHWNEGREEPLQPPEPSHGQCKHFVPLEEECGECLDELLDEEDEE